MVLCINYVNDTKAGAYLYNDNVFPLGKLLLYVVQIGIKKNIVNENDNQSVPSKYSQEMLNQQSNIYSWIAKISFCVAKVGRPLTVFLAITGYI